MRSTIRPAMKSLNIPRTMLAAIVMLASAFIAASQTPQLSLADLLIGLRSQKVSLPERNRILAEAVMERGITFAFTPEIASELSATGASQQLLDAIKVMSPKPASVSTPEPTPVPITTPTPPDFSFYQKRADENASKGNFTAALSDYDKAAEMRTDVPAIYIARGQTHNNLKSFDKAVADYDRALELSPKSSNAYVNRAISLENLGEMQKSLADFRKALEIDADNSIAKAGVTRIEGRIAKAENERLAAEEAKRLAEAPLEFLNVGILTSDNATRMTRPVYSPIAQRSGIEGRVEVEVEINEEGEVTSANATTGHQTLRSSAEQAAKRSRFKPFLFNNTPIKAKGMIVYNFTLKQ